MPTLNSWMVITLRTPFWVAILIGIILLGGITFTVFVILRKSRQAKALTSQVEEQIGTIDSINKQEHSLSSIQEAYLQFTYNISHEVSNPLQSVQINLENMAECAPEETGRRRQYYEIIKQEIKRLFALTDNLRLLSHLERVGEPVKYEPVNLKSVIDDVMMEQFERAENKNIPIKYQGPNRPAKVLGNREYLYQVIFNLVDNSIKYSKETGGEIIIKLAEGSDTMQISVTDEGIGIPLEDQPYVFDTAYRSPNTGSISRTGSGLGLAIVKRIVEQHEGQVKIDSILGKGTEVTIDLPIYGSSKRE